MVVALFSGHFLLQHDLGTRLVWSSSIPCRYVAIGYLSSTVFLRSDTAATIFLLFVLVWLLFKGGVYFVGKSADTNGGWNRYMRVIQLGLTDAGKSTRSLPNLQLSAVETSLRTQIHVALEIAQWVSACECQRVNVGGNYLYVYCVYQPRYYLRAAFISLGAADCVATIWGWRLIKEIRYIYQVAYSGILEALCYTEPLKKVSYNRLQVVCCQ